MCVNEQQYQLHSDQPILQKTKLGWIVAGPMQLPSHHSRTVCNSITNQQLHKQVERFWEIENHSIKKISSELNPLDDLEQHFLSTTEQDKDGRFIVTIPFKDEVNDLGESYTRAHKCLLDLERKLSKQPELKKAYSEFMEDYENQGHMVMISAREIKTDKVVNYLPHHAVLKEGTTTTKIRGVYNGSFPTSTGLSLNQVQRVCPIVQNDLISIMLRFRQHPIVISADIAQMYRQIKINKNQQDLQRILWRADPSLPICHYRLTTVTYGTASAPYLATRVLRQIGEENKNSYHVASEVIIRDFYVDDHLTGTSTVEEARQLKEESTKLLAASGMELWKWASNEPRVFSDLNHSTSERMIKSDKDPRTLGLFWKPETDELQYLVKEQEKQQITKRSILSTTAKIFDPFGLVGSVIIRAKIILQKLWELELSWNEALPQKFTNSLD
ncbi:uncharacterized protein LOC117178741 [Belonocnema kinseyi]|uniref:uncharacterized protein LOC117178741 n=1 Tax=Belonocnema kinseyi TaxID=2817044 RepID=UPI00143DE8AD|nr:uncharacterized protein LOC117178741 [Belonocnema kinseyi]